MSNNKIESRRAELERELARYVDALVKHENPQQIIVFGSLATGDVHEWSDIDLVIVNETELPFMERLFHAQDVIQPRVGTDILYYTPDEWLDMCENRFFVKHEVEAKGKVLYER